MYVVTFSPPTSFSSERFMSLLMSGIAGMPLVALKSDVGDGTPSDLRFTVRYLGEKLGFTQFLSPMLMMPALISLPCVLAVTSPLKAAGELTTYKGTLDGPSAAKAMGFGKTRGDYTVEVGLTDSDEVRTMIITGPFFDSADATYTIDISKYDQKVEIKQP